MEIHPYQPLSYDSAILYINEVDKLNYNIFKNNVGSLPETVGFTTAEFLVGHMSSIGVELSPHNLTEFYSYVLTEIKS